MHIFTTRVRNPFAELRNLYWHLRRVRCFDSAARRKYYRRIRRERDRLVQSGYDRELVRLFCRYMSNPAPDSPALVRLWSFDVALAKLHSIGSRSAVSVCIS